MHRLLASGSAACAVLCCAPSTFSQTSFVNWESPHVSPLDITPGGGKMLAVNTADNRLEVFTLTTNGPIYAGSVPVGLDPVSVRARTASEAWVVNHISDSLSIVDLDALHVKKTIWMGDGPNDADVASDGDEPCDVVFAQNKAFVSISQRNQVRIFDLNGTELPGSPLIIQGEEPRALATDGTNVFAAIFESGNLTTVLSQQQVSTKTLNPYQGDPNPPPNNGPTGFLPPKNPVNPASPQVGLIVKRNDGFNPPRWEDDNAGTGGPRNWTPGVTWNVHDNDVAVINASTHAVSYIKKIMNLNMAMALKPDGKISIVGTDATNHTRFEPNIKGKFVRVKGASFTFAGGSLVNVDLNSGHLNYANSTVPQSTRDQSIGDPRGIVWVSNTEAYITGMGSNNVIATDGSFVRLGRIEVGQGPTGIRYDAARNFLYVLNKFDATITTINELTRTVLTTTSFFDPTPVAIKQGRPFLYDTHATSGLGQASCASCHIDGRLDGLSWDLGDPAGTVKLFNQICQNPNGCNNWHPMKGPMNTQTLVGIVGTEPLHWRGDRENLAAFSVGFVGLLGDDVQPSNADMQMFENFVATLEFPPQPNRAFSNALATNISSAYAGTGNAQTGENRFLTQLIDGGNAACVSCHAIPAGTNQQISPGQLIAETQSLKVPQLRNLYEKVGFSKASSNNSRGFGFVKDGAIDTLFEFLKFPGFNYNTDPSTTPDAQRHQIEAFLLSFPVNTHAAVGAQTTVVSAGSPDMTLINSMSALADAGSVGLVAKGRPNALAPRGYRYNGSGVWQPDRATDSPISTAALLATVTVAGSELTFTVVPQGSQTRIGIDRDADGILDGDENSDSRDPLCLGDITLNQVVDVNDLLAVIESWGTSGADNPADLSQDGMIDVADLLIVINGWGNCF